MFGNVSATFFLHPDTHSTAIISKLQIVELLTIPTPEKHRLILQYTKVEELYGTNIYYTKSYAIPYEEQATQHRRMQRWLRAIGF